MVFVEVVVVLVVDVGVGGGDWRGWVCDGVVEFVVVDVVVVYCVCFVREVGGVVVICDVWVVLKMVI